MYQHLASLVSYPDAQLLPDVGRLHPRACAGSPRSGQPCSNTSVMPPGSWGKAPWRKPISRYLKCRPRAALYIGHQLFGEDWRRGTFMACLKERYRECGFSMRRGTAGPR